MFKTFQLYCQGAGSSSRCGSDAGCLAIARKPRKRGDKNKAGVKSKISFLKVFCNIEIAKNLHASLQKINTSAAEKPHKSLNLKF